MRQALRNMFLPGQDNFPKIIKSNAIFKDVFIYQTILFFKKSIFDEAAFVFQGISESLIYKSFLTVSL